MGHTLSTSIRGTRLLPALLWILCLSRPEVALGQTVRAQNLLSKLNLQERTVAGMWTLSESGLRSDGSRAARCILADDVPSAYSLSIEFTRLDGNETVGVVLPVGKSQCALLISVFEGEAHGIGIVDGKLARDNSTTIKPGTLTNGARHKLEISVNAAGLQASIRSTLDGKPFLEWRGEAGSLSMFRSWKLNAASELGLYVNANLTFHSISLLPYSTAPSSPSTETRSALYSLSHGEPGPGALVAVAQQAGCPLTSLNGPASADKLSNSDLLIVRAPKTRISSDEQRAIIQYVQSGGSLLIAMDEERRTGLETTDVNELVKEFGLTFEGDTEYLHNCGAICKAGEILKADREVPFSGGRSVRGGQPFGFQLDREGKQSLPFATTTQVKGGGRVIILGDAMVAGIMGTPDGVRLSGVPRNPAKTVYWGKDSAMFMEEIIRWLADD